VSTTRPAGAPPASLANLNPDGWTRPFWTAAAERRLVCQRCAACGAFRMPPAPFCPACQSQADEWTELSGRGTVYTFTVVRQSSIPQLVNAVPYVIAIVELAEAKNLLLTTNLVETEPERVHIGMPVEVVWDETAPGVVIPRFRPSD
jgi:uncharacterized OB-fold protein